jgi:hypothetical protein
VELLGTIWKDFGAACICVDTVLRVNQCKKEDSGRR